MGYLSAKSWPTRASPQGFSFRRGPCKPTCPASTPLSRTARTYLAPKLRLDPAAADRTRVRPKAPDGGYFRCRRRLAAAASTASVMVWTNGLSNSPHCQNSGTSRCSSEIRTNDLRPDAVRRGCPGTRPNPNRRAPQRRIPLLSVRSAAAGRCAGETPCWPPGYIASRLAAAPGTGVRSVVNAPITTPSRSNRADYAVVCDPAAGTLGGGVHPISTPSLPVAVA
jgi:hypothetical protein